LVYTTIVLFNVIAIYYGLRQTVPSVRPKAKSLLFGLLRCDILCCVVYL